MAKLYNTKGNKAIMYYLKQNNYTKTDIAKALDISNSTLHSYMNNPYRMTLQQLTILCGLFVCSIEELVYLVSLNKAKADKKAKLLLGTILTRADFMQTEIEKM